MNHIKITLFPSIFQSRNITLCPDMIVSAIAHCITFPPPKMPYKLLSGVKVIS